MNVYVGLVLEIEKESLKRYVTYDIKYCPTCSKTMLHDNNFCNKCGTKLSVKQEERFEVSFIQSFFPKDIVLYDTLERLYIESEETDYYASRDKSFGVFIDDIGFTNIPKIDDVDVIRFRDEIKDVLYYLDKEKVEYTIKYGIISYYD